MIWFLQRHGTAALVIWGSWVAPWHSPRGGLWGRGLVLTQPHRWGVGCWGGSPRTPTRSLLLLQPHLIVHFSHLRTALIFWIGLRGIIFRGLIQVCVGVIVGATWALLVTIVSYQIWINGRKAATPAPTSPQPWRCSNTCYILSDMHFHVDFHLLALDKPPATNFTLVWSFSCVDPDVSL